MFEYTRDGSRPIQGARLHRALRIRGLIYLMLHLSSVIANRILFWKKKKNSFIQNKTVQRVPLPRKPSPYIASAWKEGTPSRKGFPSFTLHMHKGKQNSRERQKRLTIQYNLVTRNQKIPNPRALYIDTFDWNIQNSTLDYNFYLASNPIYHRNIEIPNRIIPSPPNLRRKTA